MQYFLPLDSHLLEILEILRDGDIHPRLVGGYVRDKIIQKESSDIDIATPLLPSEVIERLNRADISVIPTGIKHGTVTAISKGQVFEITTLRQDLYCDGRHAQVSFSKDFMQDALRRDFTINALSYAHVEQKVYDYFGGLTHLSGRQVIFIGKPEERILEDYLRIMRFFRFSATYASELDPASFSACLELSHLITKLSRERIHAELNKLLLAPRGAEILSLMHPILRLIFASQYNVEALVLAVKIAQKLDIKLTLPSLYSALLSKVKDIGLLKQDLRANCFSNQLSSKILQSLAFLKDLRQTRNPQLIYKTHWLEEPASIPQYLVLGMMSGDTGEEEGRILYKDYKHKIWPGRLPVSGFELQELGYQGKELGNCLAKLKELWIQNDFQLTKEELLAMAR